MVNSFKKYTKEVGRLWRLAPWLSWLKRLPSKQEIAGSNPTGACLFYSVKYQCMSVAVINVCTL